MDDKEFKRKLSEVATWKIPENLQELEKATPRKRRKIEVLDNDNDGYNETDNDENQDLVEEIDTKDQNLPIQLVGLRVQGCVCEDCGRRCPSGRKTEAKVYETTTRKAWRHRCVTCGLWKNPYSGEFDLKREEYVIVWTNWGRGIKECYASEIPVKKSTKTKY